ncbi:hypothetical protein ACP_2472 [Acidobacterium capsulatum ATCC 51196]|uniref:Uncharacterized protein n=1 Tax=Acidobacterium capsulatum (strain ATCC 51196 / DSM 11244 / BCRC 80197 / JCM 7670 / NBRC 15755 / NCIMB 13165 / 161) TaxID=240015 RepID=C1F1G4_ACIC5|nr:hypothetical protein ACP_2472 [Acidobacterium capsulatum ATCC 51196]
MALTRHILLRNGAFALVGTAVIPAFLTRTLHAQTAAARAWQGAGGGVSARRGPSR